VAVSNSEADMIGLLGPIGVADRISICGALAKLSLACHVGSFIVVTSFSGV
jgi:hypothetical protein